MLQGRPSEYDSYYHDLVGPFYYGTIVTKSRQCNLSYVISDINILENGFGRV